MESCKETAWPRVGVGAVVFKDNRVLLVLRGNSPAKGKWAIPGGKVNPGETLKDACEREILEETGIRIRAKEPVFTFDLVDKDEAGKIRFHYVIIDFTADYLEGEPVPGDDAADARWVRQGELKSLDVNRKTVKLLKEMFEFG